MRLVQTYIILVLDGMKSQKNNSGIKILINKTRYSAGFTLLELLIVVAIIGILAGVGIPAYNGYIQNSKEDVAKNNLRSISLMEASYFSDNNSYYLSTSTSAINSNLFNKNTLDSSSDYDYSVVSHDSGFEAVAKPKNGKSVTKFCLTQNNDLKSASQCP